MAEFETSGSVFIEIDQGSLRDARRDVEESIGSVQVDVEGGGISGPRTATESGDDDVDVAQTAMLEIQRRTLKAQQSSADFDQERNIILEEMLDIMEDDEGGGLFGSGDGDGPGPGPGGDGLLPDIPPGTGLLGLAGLGSGGFSLPGISANVGARGAGLALSSMMFGGMGVRTGDPSSERLIPGGPDDPIGQGIANAMEDAVSGVQQTFQDLSNEQLSVTEDPNLDLPQQTLDLNLPGFLQDMLGGGTSGPLGPGKQMLRPRIQAQQESLQRFDQRANQVDIDMGDIQMTVDDVTNVEDTVNRKLSQAKREIQRQIMESLESDPQTAQAISTNQLKQLHGRF